MFPLMLIVFVVSMVGAYQVVAGLGDNAGVTEENALLLNTENIVQRSANLFEQLRSEARRVTLTAGVVEALGGGTTVSLQGSLEALAHLARLDALIIADANGREQLGLLRLRTGDDVTYSTETGVDLTHEAYRTVLGAVNASTTGTALVGSAEGLLIMVAQPIVSEGRVVGMVVVGQSLENFVGALRTDVNAFVSLYDERGTLLATSFDLNAVAVTDLGLSSGEVRQVFDGFERVLAPLHLGDLTYRQALVPFEFGGETLGVVAVAQPNNVAFATFGGQQVVALFAALFTGVVVLVVLGGVSTMVGRMEDITDVIRGLRRGETRPTTIRPAEKTDVPSQAIGAHTSKVANREDKLRGLLHRQRRERNYLLAVLEAMPEGVLVQDEDGHLIVINATGRELLGGQVTDKTLTQFDTLIGQKLGKTITPGLYALGDPLAIEQDGKMLSAQAAAVLSPAQKRLGTVILMRDITNIVRQSQAQAQMIEQLSEDVQKPLVQLAQDSAMNPNALVYEFTRHISQHAATLQKMIVEMRELTRYSQVTARPHQRMIAVETLIWAVVNDWRQIIQAADLHLQVDIGKTGLFILGDESRLRYALGNIIDNALKYTLAGGSISLEVQDAVDEAVHLRIRDNGVGISPEDYPHLFTPFYRGTPMSADGQLIRVPGMGQGLTEARQIIQAHGGVMRVKTRQHMGTAVYVALPLTSGVGYQLPTVADDMEGDTVILSDDIDIETYWHKE